LQNLYNGGYDDYCGYNFNEKNYFEFIFRKNVNDFEESQRIEKIKDAVEHSEWNIFGNVGIQIK
jgi:hypothetical protein